MDRNYFNRRDSVPCPDRQITFNVFERVSPSVSEENPLHTVLCIHGAGYTGLSWALFANTLSSLATTPLRIVAPDLRGHGLTFSSMVCAPSCQSPEDLSMDILVDDVVALCRQLDLDLKRTVVVGHSMGGALAVRIAAYYFKTTSIKLGGLVVIDIVEGTALASVPHMKKLLASRPKYFKDTASAVEWAIQSGVNTRKEAAAISIPSQLCETRCSAINLNKEADVLGSISENREEVELGRTDSHPEENTGEVSSSVGWTWRTNVEATCSNWEGWYRGLSDAFLSVKAPKMLILAGTDRLDKVLTIAQMQGKFQLVVLPRAGHAVHEDEYDKVAQSVWNFISRYQNGDLQSLLSTSTLPGSVFRR